MSLRKVATGFAYFWAYMLVFLAVVGGIGVIALLLWQGRIYEEMDRRAREKRALVRPNASEPSLQETN